MSKSNKLTPEDNVLLSDGNKCKLAKLSDMRYFETFGNYSKAFYSDGMMLIHRSLSYLETRLAEEYFFRTNRQYIINLSHVECVQLIKNSVYRVELSCGKQINISRRRSTLFKDSLAI